MLGCVRAFTSSTAEACIVAHCKRGVQHSANVLRLGVDHAPCGTQHWPVARDLIDSDPYGMSLDSVHPSPPRARLRVGSSQSHVEGKARSAHTQEGRHLFQRRTHMVSEILRPDRNPHAGELLNKKLLVRLTLLVWDRGVRDTGM